MTELIRKLPFDVAYHEVLNDRFANIQFKVLYTENDSDRYFTHNYSKRYETIVDSLGDYIRKSIVEDGCKYNVMLSRIAKKNNKHRYYLTFELVFKDYVSCGCRNRDCRDRMCGQMEEQLVYSSRFIGKDLVQAIMIWYSISDTTKKSEFFK
uniref:Uncharacterized protein n=1 Tax=viral metagenome TaxID=1070528 RepID=A0A6C0LKJ1_9ZZZZ